MQPGKAVLASKRRSRGAAGAKYLVYIGCRRFYACRKAGLRSFKAIVVNHMEEGRLQRELLTENVKRANLSVLVRTSPKYFVRIQLFKRAAEGRRRGRPPEPPATRSSETVSKHSRPLNESRRDH